MVFAFLDLETDNRADEGCAQLGHEFVPRIVGAARLNQGFSVEAAFMPCMVHGLMRKRGILVVGGMERFKSGPLDLVVAGEVIGLRSDGATSCVESREHPFKLNVKTEHESR